MTAQEGKLSQYTKDLPSQIEQQIKKAWSPSVKEAIGVVGNQLESFAPTFFDYYSTLGGTTSADMNPMQKLEFMGGQFGRQTGALTRASEYADYLGARSDEMYQKAYDAMNLGYQRESDAYNRLANQYQLAWQSAENEKTRAASGGSGGGFVFEPPPTEESTEQALEPLNQMQLYKAIMSIPAWSSPQEKRVAIQGLVNRFSGNLDKNAVLKMAYQWGGVPNEWAAGGASSSW